MDLREQMVNSQTIFEGKIIKVTNDIIVIGKSLRSKLDSMRSFW